MTNELSKNLITHKLVMRGEKIQYIDEDTAKFIYTKIKADPQTRTITIENPQDFTIITKYKTEVNIIKLDPNSTELEDILYKSCLPDYKKDIVRNIIEGRKKLNQSLSPVVIVAIIAAERKK